MVTDGKGKVPSKEDVDISRFDRENNDDDIRIKEINDRHNIDIERLENERVSSFNHITISMRTIKDELERKLHQLMEQNERQQRECDRHEEEVAELKRKEQIEIDRLKQEMNRMHDNQLNEMDDERDEYRKVCSSQYRTIYYKQYCFAELIVHSICR
jgi:hypothetical protein